MKVLQVISFLFYRTWAKIMIREAKSRKQETRKRHWVIRLRNRIYCFKREQIKWYKKHGKFKEELNFIDLDKIAIYDTK